MGLGFGVHRSVPMYIRTTSKSQWVVGMEKVDPQGGQHKDGGRP